MWWQAIPAYIIVTAGVGAPAYAAWWLHYLVLGNHFRRGLIDRWERHQYQRDLRLTGHPYVVNGLEQIEDMKPNKAKK